MIPAREVGGDLYDFFLIDKSRVGVIIGDVSGKGIPAAMFMAVSKTLLKATALKGIPPDSCLESVNNILVDESLPSMFVTVFYGIFDTRNGSLEYCNGGHNPPYLISAGGEVRQLDNRGGVFLGALKNLEYESNVVMLQPGETLFLITDGITEAMNTREEMFGEERSQAALQMHAGKPLPELVQKVIEEVQAFAGAQEQSDDLTCLTLRYFGR